MEHLILADEEAPRVGRWSIGVAACAGLALLVGTLVLDVVHPAPKRRPIGAELDQYRALQRAANPWDGSLARLIERSLGLRSRSRRLLGPFSTAVQLRLGRIAPEKGILLGDGDWMFLEERAGLDADAAERATRSGPDLLGAIEERLAAVGARALFVLVPRKVTLAAEHVPAGRLGAPGYDDALFARCTAAGLPVVDLLTPLRSELGTAAFPERESHWSTAGAWLAAREIARSLDVPEVLRTAPPVRTTTVMGVADLLDSLGIGEDHPTSRLFDPVVREAVRVESVTPAADPAIRLVGTSFSDSYFMAARITRELGAPVESLAQPGLAFTEVLALGLEESAAAGDFGRWWIVELPSFQLVGLAAFDPYLARQGGRLLESLPAVPWRTLGDARTLGVGSADWTEVCGPGELGPWHGARPWITVEIVEETEVDPGAEHGDRGGETAVYDVRSGGLYFRLHLEPGRAVALPVLDGGPVAVRPAGQSVAGALSVRRVHIDR